MCGIFGYVGKGDVCKILYQGLKSLEYRGYDSAGMAVIGDKLSFIKDKGTIDDVLTDVSFPVNSVGIAHTRWATHGKPNQINAHPHFDEKNKVAVIHNGIIENYKQLKEGLIKKGHIFKSKTDTEVIPHLIEENLSLGNFEAFKKAVAQLKGSYAIACIIEGSDKIYFAKKFSPLVLGVNNDYFLASDIVSFLRWTKQVIFIEEGDIGYLEKGKIYIENNGRQVNRLPNEIRWTFEEAAKDGYDHFMLKEIFEQPQAIAKTLADKRLISFSKHMSEIDKLVITSAGTSFHAGLALKYVSSLPLEVIIASEFSELYRGGEVLSISQSGETADTLRAVRLAKSLNQKVDALVNVVGSTLTRIADRVIYTHAGPEIGVASTKTFASQLAALFQINALMKGETLPKIDINPVLKKANEIESISKILAKSTTMFYLGRGVNTVTAMEGALKMKELAYLHAEAYPGGELKHGPLALIEESLPIVAICPSDKKRDKMLGNIEEVKSRGAFIIGLGYEKDKELIDLSDKFIAMPEVDSSLTPLYYSIPLQLLAYYTAIELKQNPDKPRNLAKSVTVE